MQNLWGAGWGESGYVRMRHGPAFDAANGGWGERNKYKKLVFITYEAPDNPTASVGPADIDPSIVFALPPSLTPSATPSRSPSPSASPSRPSHSPSPSPSATRLSSSPSPSPSTSGPPSRSAWPSRPLPASATLTPNVTRGVSAATTLGVTFAVRGPGGAIAAQLGNSSVLAAVKLDAARLLHAPADWLSHVVAGTRRRLQETAAGSWTVAVSPPAGALVSVAAAVDALLALPPAQLAAGLAASLASLAAAAGIQASALSAGAALATVNGAACPAAGCSALVAGASPSPAAAAAAPAVPVAAIAGGAVGGAAALALVAAAAAVLVVRRRRRQRLRAVRRPSFVSRPHLEPPSGTVVMAARR